MKLKEVWANVVNYFDLQRDNRNKPATEPKPAVPPRPGVFGKVVDYFDLQKNNRQPK
ncbi:MAG: hypothetical protein JWR51_4758 [Devosia sp.]|uniref:hypothetical protein n=1 Tax=Devosia sp. TaxID=1871048 RepID=UPI0026040D7A|nr:hypothetical protein [Devosia sp.]MDB5531655.1 hypothetical protein [Devosia sp.]